jgi:hypothetical protein
MAKQGSFGAYSSVPTTTGMGQGSAQVFTPQAGRLDTTALQRGVQNLGQGIAQADANKKKAEADRKKKMMDVTSAAYDQKTDFPKTEALKQREIDKFNESVINGESIDVAERNMMKNLGYIDVINKQAKGGYKNAQSQSGEYKDALYWDEENMKYENPTYQYEFLGDTSIDDVEDIQLWTSDTMEKISPKANENIMYNPKFTEGDMNKALLDEIDASLRLKGKEKLNRVYDDRTGELIVQETLTGIDDDVYNNALEAVQSRPDFLASYMTTRAIEEGNSPSVLNDQNAKDIYQQDFNAFVQQTGERYRPSKMETKTLKKPSEASAARAAVQGAIGEPAPLDAPVMIDGKPQTAYGVTINVDEDLPLRVEGNPSLGRPRTLRKVGEDKYELEYTEYEKVSDGMSADELAKLSEVGQIMAMGTGKGGKQEYYRLDKSNVKTVPIKEGDLNWNAMESLIAKTSKAQGADVTNRLKSLTEIEVGKKTPNTTEVIKVEGTPDIKTWKPEQQYEYNNTIYFYDNTTKKWKSKSK